MTKITAIIPTFNEEENIERALSSVSFAEEIIVIDSYSEDNTLSIAKKHPKVEIIQRQFDDFSSQKNYAISQAKNNWVVVLDADEEIPEKLQQEIVERVKNPEDFSAFYMYRNFYFKDKKLNFTLSRNDKVIRLFKKEENKYRGKVHETIIPSGKVGSLINKLDHYSYKSYGHYKNKLKQYAQLQAEELLEKKIIVTPYHLLLKPLIRFVSHFVIKLGFLDGFRGFLISFLHAQGVFFRYTELLKLKNANQENFNNQTSKISDKYKIGFDAKRAFHNTTGLGNYSRDLIRILSEFYSDNYYFLYNPKPKKVKRLQLTSNMIEVLPQSKLWKKFSSIWRQKAISKQINGDNVEIFHGLSGELPRGLDSKIKKVVTIHDLIFVRYPNLYSFFDRKIHFYKFKYACKVADRVVAISEQTKRDIIEFLKVDSAKIDVVYQGCHHIFKEEISQIDREDVLRKYNLPKDFILNVGTVEERKNALTIVKAIKNIDTNLVVIGRKTKYYQKIETFIAENSLQEKVYFLEGLTLKELASLYQSAKMTVYPSIFEGFGIPIIESLYSKTPVIANANGVFPEAAGPNSVYLKNPLDENEMKIAIEDLLSSESKRKEIAEKGFKFVQKFNDDVIAENLMNVYEKLAKTNH